jgi:rubredoxin
MEDLKKCFDFGRQIAEKISMGAINEKGDIVNEKDTLLRVYQCPFCGLQFAETDGEKFSDLPETWGCPFCGMPKRGFVLIG